tara:strand:- start:552 stop:980 length:429 start_codon:yes stop_codon:yes gene_type:complete
MINNKKFLIKKIFLFTFAILLIELVQNKSFGVEPNEILDNPKQELRARNISKNIRCLVCQNQSIDDSNASLAKDLRVLIRSKIEDGENDKEIYKYLTDRYGDFILLKPPLKLNTIALWLLPFIFLLIGIYIIFIYNKKSNKI